jgi:hypothetical protein
MEGFNKVTEQGLDAKVLRQEVELGRAQQGHEAEVGISRKGWSPFSVFSRSPRCPERDARPARSVAACGQRKDGIKKLQIRSPARLSPRKRRERGSIHVISNNGIQVNRLIWLPVSTKAPVIQATERACRRRVVQEVQKEVPAANGEQITKASQNLRRLCEAYR